MAYGIKTTNVFELLGESEGGDEAPPVVKASEIKKKEAPSKVPENAKPDAPASKPVAAGVEARLRGQAAASDPPRGRGRGARSPRGARGGGRADDRPVREEIPSDASEATNGPTNRGRGGRIGGRGGRGRGRDGEFGERRRQYDRHDASGRGYEPEKRHGAGKGNWGAEGDEAAEAEKATAPEEATAPAEDETPPPAGDDAPAADAADAEPETPKEPEKPEMTLEEYEALVAEKRNALRKQPVKAANKSVEQDFAGMKAFERKNTEDDTALELQNKKVIGARKSGTIDKGRKEKETVETGFRFDEASPRSFGRGGRGGRGRGDFGGERDFPRGERGPPREGGDRPSFGGRARGRGEGRGRGVGRNGPTPNFDDAAAFPTLGGT